MGGGRSQEVLPTIVSDNKTNYSETLLCTLKEKPLGRSLFNSPDDHLGKARIPWDT